MVRQTGLVLWRTLYIQALRRHWLATMLEVLLVTVCFAQLRHHTRPKDENYAGFNPAVTYPARALAEIVSEGASIGGRTVCYGPSTKYAQLLMDSAYPRREQHDLRADSDSTTTTFDHVYVDRDAEVRSACQELSRRQRAHIVPCLRFHGGETALNYSVYVYTDEQITANDLAFRVPLVFKPPGEPSKLLTHIFSTLARVNLAHIRFMSNNTEDLPMQFQFKRFPHPSLPKDMPNYASVVGLILMIGFLVPFCLRVQAMVQENANGLKEVQRLMGLSDASYWTGHFFSHLFLALLESGCAVLCVLLLTGSDSEEALLERVNPWLLILSFGLFSVLFSLHVLLVACFFTNGSVAVTFAMLYWVILCFVLPCALIENYAPSLAGYLLASREKKLLSSVTPTLGTYWILKILMIAHDLKGSAGWDLVIRRVLNLDNVCIGEIWLTMIAACCLIFLMVAYLAQVLPWVTGIPKPFYFPLMYRHWFPAVQDLKAGAASPVDKYPGYFQLPPVDAAPVITVQGLTKDYGGVVAVENVDLEIYEGLITVILGHNGAGKTTVLNILTGVCSPTSGSVNVCGFDVVQNTAEARVNLCFCQQQDVFFPDLTVWEHLAYFGALKGINRNSLQGRINEILRLVRLEDKAKCATSVLSGGMKKRLSVAIATICRPKVVVLDEPTSGLDPETRRDIWDLFRSMRRECTLLISTHDMAEADMLGDRIVVMAHGAVQCCGSPAFLKKAFGAGYRVHIMRKPSVAFQLYDIMQIIKSTVPEAEVKRHRPSEVTVALHLLDCAGFEDMFKQLEANSDALGIDSIGVSVATIQDVFIKINREEARLQTGTAPLTDGELTRRAATTEGIGNTCGASTVALLLKRVLYFYRSTVPPLTAWLLPLVVFWALMALEQSLLPELPRRLQRLAVPLSLGAAYPGSAVFLHAGDEELLVARDTFLPLLQGQAARVDVLADPASQLPAVAAQDFYAYTQDYVLGILVTQRTVELASGNESVISVEAWHNPYATLSRELALAVSSTAALRLLKTDQRATIAARAVIRDMGGTRSEHTKDADEVLTEYLKRSFLTTLLRCFMVPLGCALLMSSFVLQPTAERASGAKDLQLMTGLSGATYWSANWIFDFFVYLFAWAAVCALISFYQPFLVVTKLSLLVVLVVFSLPGILFAYTVSLFAKTQSGGFTFLVLIYAVGGTVLLFSYMARKVTARGGLLPTSPGDIFFMLAPPFSLSVSLIKVLRMDFENKECLRARQSLSYLTLFCDLANPSHKVHFGAVSAHCCAHANESSWQPLSSITLDVNGVGYELLVMLMEAVVLFCVLAYWDSGHRCARVFGMTLGAASAKASPASPDTLDEDVRHEHEEVVRLRREKLFHERALLVENLHKKYGSLRAVRGLTFGVHQQECFGLLGVNGSGKTTTFQMLTALVPPTRGEAYMGDYVLSREPRLWQARLGYCMQYGGLLESLTAYEFLRLFARLRGVPSKDAKPLVESFVELVGLQACADRPCGTYSGGGKRKLSMAAALIGLPRLVFLDEPTAGVDVVAKTRIFAALADIMSYSGISIVLNSHSMDDCESVCDRIAIMSNGQMQCLGTLQRLKDRFGGGYTLVLKLAPKERVRDKDVQVSIQRVFVCAALKDYREGVFKFHLLQKLRWSEVFTRVNELQKCYSFEYAFVSDCSLEDIFVDIARRPTSSIALKGTSK